MDTTGTIVCGVDRSPAGRAAAGVAARLSGRLGCRLVLVHAVQPPISTRGVGTPVASTGFAAVEQMREAGARMLDELGVELGSGRDIVREVRLGGASEVIASVAEDEAAELVVVGSRGLGSVGALILGSVSGWLAAHGPCPTIVVPPAARTSGNGPILCAVDDSEQARAALATAAALAERLGAELVVLHVGLEDAPSSRGLELLARLIVEAGLGTRVERTLARGEPAEAIVEAADANDAALVVVGSRGRGALASSVLGSVSAAVAGRAARPVMVVRAGAATSAA